MENGEPNDGSDDGCNNQEYESVPRDIPHSLLQPIRPYSEQEEEEYETNSEDQLQLDARTSTSSFDLEDIETNRCNRLMLFWNNLHNLWLLGCRIVRVRVLLTEWNNSHHCAESNEAHNKVA